MLLFGNLKKGRQTKLLIETFHTYMFIFHTYIFCIVNNKVKKRF